MTPSLRLLQLPDRPQDFFVVPDVAAGLVLRVHQLSVDLDVEDASVARDLPDPDSELLLDRCRQTGGNRIVVSDLAEGDDHLHELLLVRGRRLDRVDAF
jgi:hypothetical protein